MCVFFLFFLSSCLKIFDFRFNQHSILVLKASEQAAGAEPAVVEAAPPKRVWKYNFKKFEIMKPILFTCR